MKAQLKDDLSTNRLLREILSGKATGKSQFGKSLRLLLQFHQLGPQGIVILFRSCTELQVPITNDSVLVDEKDRALIDSAELRREAGIRFRNRVVVILQERERQLMSLSPLVMRKNVIAAYSEKFRVELAKVVPSVPEGTYFVVQPPVQSAT